MLSELFTSSQLLGTIGRDEVLSNHGAKSHAPAGREVCCLIIVFHVAARLYVL